MEYNLDNAIEQMRQKEETGLNYVYSKTYNYVYLRAKTILGRESDVQQLMQDVYVKCFESAAEIDKEHLYEWLGKCVYTLGCQRYRKKRGQEATVFEIEEQELTARKTENIDAVTEVVTKSMEHLPDLYQATFYAFYYDFMTVEDIAEVMDCEEGVIINRLNYTRKFILRAMENYQDEHKVKLSFTVEGMCMALRKWSVEHGLGMTTAQNVYAEIARSVNVLPKAIYLEGKEFAGVNNTVVYHKADDFSAIEEQVAMYSPKFSVDKNKILKGIMILFAVVVVVIGLFFVANSLDKKEAKKPSPQKQEEQIDETEQQPEEETEPEKPAEDTDAEAANYIIPESATRKLTQEDIEGLSKEQLRLARNEIYARHGMIFGAEDLDTYFRTKSWYVPKVSFDDFYDSVEMSLIEEANVSFIQQAENAL